MEVFEMQNKTFQLETLSCPTCVKKIETMLKKTDGIKDVEVLFMSSKVKVDFNEDLINASQISEKIEKLGYDVLGVK
jgi:copper ion binding protein